MKCIFEVRKKRFDAPNTAWADIEIGHRSVSLEIVESVPISNSSRFSWTRRLIGNSFYNMMHNIGMRGFVNALTEQESEHP